MLIMQDTKQILCECIGWIDVIVDVDQLGLHPCSPFLNGIILGVNVSGTLGDVVSISKDDLKTRKF